MKLQLKRSLIAGAKGSQAITALGKAKQPTVLEYGELAVNYSTEDPTIFMKKVDGSIVEPYFKKNSLQHLTPLS